MRTGAFGPLPAVGWLWPCGRQQLVLEGGVASLSPPLFVFGLLTHRLYQLSVGSGGWPVW